MAIIQALGQKALEKTSSTLSNFAKGAFQAGMAEAPGIAYGYSALRNMSSRFSSTTPKFSSTTSSSNGVSAKEARNATAVNMLMLREMKQMNLGIQNLNRIMAYQMALTRRANAFQEERDRESQLQNDRLIDTLKKLGTNGRNLNTVSSDGGGLLGGLLGSALRTGAMGLGAGAGLIAGGYGARRLLGIGAGTAVGGTLLNRGGGTPAIGGRQAPLQLGWNGRMGGQAVSSAGGGASRMLSGLGSAAGMLGRGALRMIPYVGWGLLAYELFNLLKGSPANASTLASNPLNEALANATMTRGGTQTQRSGQTDPAYVPPRSVRQNNPGNLRAVGATTGFRSFNTPQEGLAALHNQLRLYITGKSRWGKRDTIASIISIYAPPSENKTGKYIDFVSGELGKGANERLTLGDIPALAKAITEMEGGAAAVAYFYGGGGRLSAGGGGRGRPPVGSQSAASDTGEIPGVTTRSSSVASVQQAGGGTAVDKFLQVLPVYDKKADENSKKLLGQTTKTAEATTSSNVANFGRVRPTKVTKTPYEIANEKFINSFGKVTERVYKRELDQFAQKIFGKDYARGMTAAQGARSGVVGRSAGKILGIDRAATKLFGRDYGPVFAQLGKDYMEEGLRSVGEILFTGQVGDDARGLTGAILGNYAQGNKKAAKEQLIYGLLGVPTGPQSLTMFLGGPNSPFPSLKGVKNPRDLVNKIAENAAQGTQDMLFGGPPGSGQGGGIIGGIFGRGTGAGTGSGTVDTFNAWETYSNESLVQQQTQTGLLESIFGANTQGNSIFGAVGSGIMKSLGAVGSGILKGINWLGGTLSNVVASLFKGLGSIFGGGGGNFFSNLLNMGSNVLDFGKAIFNVGSITDFGGSYLTNLGSTALNAVGLAGTATSYAAMVPGLSSVAAGSQAAMLASQTAVFGAEGLAATAAAGQVAGTTAAASTTAAAGSGFMSSLAAAAPYIAVAAIAFSLFSGKSKTPKLERGIITLGNNDITQKFDINNIKMDPNKKLYQAVAPLLDSLLNVVFTAVKNIQAKTKAEPPMLAIGMRYTDKDKKLMMKLYNPSEKIGGDPKWKKYYGTLNDSFDGARVAAEMIRDIQAYYSEGKDESAITAITEASNEIMGTSFQELSSGKFSGLSTLDQTAPLNEQEAELARLIRTNMMNRPETVFQDDGDYQTFYNPLTGKYERGINGVGQIGFDEQGRAIIDVNRSGQIDLEDIQRSQALQERSVVEAFMNNYNQNNYDSQINYNEAVRLSLGQMWAEVNYDPYGG